MYVNFSKSDNPKKKMTAIFYNEDMKKIKTTHFGATGYSDYTIHKDPERKKRYIDRHKSKENFNDYMSSGSLAKNILWNKPTLKSSINDYVKMFQLKLVN